jgi:hypothetical protein
MLLKLRAHSWRRVSGVLNGATGRCTLSVDVLDAQGHTWPRALLCGCGRRVPACGLRHSSGTLAVMVIQHTRQQLILCQSRNKNLDEAQNTFLSSKSACELTGSTSEAGECFLCGVAWMYISYAVMAHYRPVQSSEKFNLPS